MTFFLAFYHQLDIDLPLEWFPKPPCDPVFVSKCVCNIFFIVVIIIIVVVVIVVVLHPWVGLDLLFEVT